MRPRVEIFQTHTYTGTSIYAKELQLLFGIEEEAEGEEDTREAGERSTISRKRHLQGCLKEEEEGEREGGEGDG